MRPSRLPLLSLPLCAVTALIAGCAEPPPPPAPTPKTPIMLPYEATADTVHVRTPSVAHRTEHRGGAAIREEADIHVLWNTHAEATTNPERLKTWQREMDGTDDADTTPAPTGRDVSIYAKTKLGVKP